MFQKVIVAGVSLLTVMLMIGSTVEAGTGTVSGTSVSQCICFTCSGAIISCSKPKSSTTCSTSTWRTKVCSIGVETILKQLGNVTNTDTLYRVRLWAKGGNAFCVNKPGNTETAEGQPFTPTDVTKGDQITSNDIEKNGRALSDILFTDEEIVFGQNITCPNQNWSLKVLVTELEAWGQLLRDDDGTNSGPCNLTNPATFGACTLADELRVNCTSPGGVTVNQPFDYMCEELCHNNADNDPTTGCPPNFDTATAPMVP
jgi:hypothetical protein